MNAKDRKALREARLDLESRLIGANAARTPGAVSPEGVYWNGFYVGVNVALEALAKVEEGRDAK